MQTSKLLAVGLALLAPLPAHGLEAEAFVSQRFFTQSLPGEIGLALLRFPSEGAFDLSRTTYQLVATGHVRGRPTDVLGLQLGLDTGLLEVNGQGLVPDAATVRELAAQSLFIGETRFDLQLGEGGWIQLEGGKLLGDIANRALFSWYALGLRLDIDPSYQDPDARWRVKAHAVLPDSSFSAGGKKNPLLSTEVGWAFDPRARVWLTASVFVDNEDGLSGVLADALSRDRVGKLDDLLDAVEQDRNITLSRRDELLRALSDGLNGLEPHTEGVLSWFGARAELERDDFELRASVMVQVGRYEVQLTGAGGLDGALEQLRASAPRAGGIIDTYGLEILSEEATSLAFYGDASGRWIIAPWVTARAFSIVATGDDGFDDGSDGAVKDRSFLSIAPRITEASIFFDGGAASTLTFPTAASVAPDGAGLIATGAGVEFTPHDTLFVDVSAAWFSSLGGTGVSGRVFGAELDASAMYAPLSWLAVRANGALFIPGGYYGPGVGLAHQVALAVEVTTP